MKLNELLTKSLNETIANIDVAKVQPFADDNGNVQKIIIEYIPKHAACTDNRQLKETF